MDRGAYLLEACKHRDISVEQIAEALGMDRSTFYRKVKDPQASFSVKDMIIINKTLGLEKIDLNTIFF